MSSQVCDHNCFECQYEDCIIDEITKEEFDLQQQNDKEFKVRKKKVWEGQREASKRYYWEHREECLEKNKKYYHTHKEKFKEYDRIRKQTHPVSPEKRHEYYIRWRDKKLSSREESSKIKEK